jgi:WD40 repeat protein
VILWDVTNRAQPRQLGMPLTGHTASVSSVAFAPDGRTLATADRDGTVILWDLTDPGRPHQLGKPLTGHTKPVFEVAFAPNGHTLATAGEDATVILWDVTNRAQPLQIGQPLTGYADPVFEVAFAPNSHTLATVSHGGKEITNGTVILWDLTDPQRPRRLGQPFTDHSTSVFKVAFSPDGHALTTVSHSGITQWDLTNLNKLRNQAVERACFITGRGLGQDEWTRYISGLPYQDTCSA